MHRPPVLNAADHATEVHLASASQQRLWLLHQIDPDLPVYNMPKVWRLTGSLNSGVLESALAELIARHEPLRTNFVLRDGKLFQIVGPAPESNHLPVLDLTGRPDPERELNRIVEEQVSRPFDLERDLMLRSTLVRLASDEHVLILVTHHLASDQWSTWIFQRDLEILYESLSQHRPHPSVHYRHYAAWEEKYLSTDQAKRSLKYWKDHLAGAPLLLHLPTDRPRPAVQKHKGTQHSFTIPEPLVTELRQFCRKAKVTLSTALLGAFQTLLFRSSHQSSFVIGIPVAGRSRPEFEDLIGNFVNSLPLRADLADDPPFAVLLRRISQTMAESLDHQETPFQAVIDAIRPERDMSYAPVFQVMFNFVNVTGKPLRLRGLTVERMEVHNRTSLQDLTLYLNPDGKALLGIFEYDADLFDAATMARFEARLLKLIESAIQNPELPVSRLPWIPAGELATLTAWNFTRADFPENQSIHQLVEERARRTPDALAAVCDGQALTFAQLDERANRVANYLVSLGAGAGSKIPIGMERSLDMVVGLLGILKTGAAYVPLDLSLPPARLQSMVDDSGAALLLTHRLATHRSAAIAIGGPRQVPIPVLIEDAMRMADSSAPPPLRTSAAPAYLIYTSGTTGQPKGVVISHRSVVNLLESMRHAPGFTERDTLLAITPLSFDIAALEIFLPLIAGARLEIATREVVLDPVALARKLTESVTTVMQATPATWRMLIDSGWKGNPHLRAWSGGETLPRDLANQILDRTGSLWNLYGPTETTIWSTVSKLNRGNDPPSIGTPIANTSLFIIDANLQTVPIGIPGELCIGGSGLADGYWNQPALTADRFIPHPSEPGARIYRTGDWARYLPSGELQWLRRMDTQIKLRGHRIELAEIENCLRAHPLVEAAVAAVRSDRSGSSSLIAYVVPRAEAAVDVNSLRQWAKDRLPDYMVPSAFVTLDSLPLTPHGKIDRAAFPDPSVELLKLDEAGSSRNALEAKLAGIWEEVLSVHGIGLQDDFFVLGGHSMLAARLFSRIEEEFGKRLPLSSLFRFPTVESLAALLGNLLPESWRAVVPIQPEGSRPPLFLVSRLHPFCYRTLGGELGSDQPLYGLQPPGLSGEGKVLPRIEELAEFHLESLRLIQPSGPYYIGGYSFGAYIAYEMARQLDARGDGVALLVIIDADVHALPRYLENLPRIRSALYRMVRGAHSAKHHWNAIRSMTAREAPKYVAGLFNQQAALRERALPEGIWNRTLPPEVQGVEAANRLAFRDYLPGPFRGRVLLFRPSSGAGVHDPQSDGWNSLTAGGVTKHEVLGSGHLDILEHPHAQFVSKILRDAMNEATRRQKMGTTES